MREAIAFLISTAPALAAERVKTGGTSAIRRLMPSATPDALDTLAVENLLLELSGNPLLAIIVPSLGLANIFIANDPLVPPHVSEVVAINRRILRAIEKGDVGSAGTLAQAKFQIMHKPTASFRQVA
jgi:hypothetical protein